MNISIFKWFTFLLCWLLSFASVLAGPLHDATMNGNLSEVKQFIQEGMDINARDKLKRTPLHYAAEEGHVAAAELLIEKGADVNAQAHYGVTPLYLASRSDECLNPPCRVSPGVSKGQRSIVELLIEHGADVNAMLMDGITPLMGAAICNAVDVAQLLIDHGADLNHRGNQYTALEIASSRGPNVAILMIKSGAEVNASDKYTKSTPLHTAVGCGYVELVEVLLQHGADLYAKDNWDSTPIDRAKDPRIIDAINRHLEKLEK